MTHGTCRLTAKNRDQLRNRTLGNRVWATFTFQSLNCVARSHSFTRREMPASPATSNPHNFRASSLCLSGRCAQCLVTAHRQHAVQNTQSRAAAAAVSGDNEITSACQLATVHGNLSRTTIHNASNHRSSSAAMPLSPRYRLLQSILLGRRRTTGADY